MSKATKKRSKESAFNSSTLSVHSVQFLFMGAPKARCSPERRMFETLLLANSYTHTLRPVRSRASTLAKKTRTASRVSMASFFCELAVQPALLFWLVGYTADAYFKLRVCSSTAWPAHYFCRLRPHAHFSSLVSKLVAEWFAMRTNSEAGFSRIARGAPWAGSVTGGEACGYPCSEKEGFTHPSLLRAPCFWGTHEWKLHAVEDRKSVV